MPRKLLSPWQNSFRALLFRLLPYPKRLRGRAAAAALYAAAPCRSGGDAATHPPVPGQKIAAMERLLPPLSAEASAIPTPLVVPGPPVRGAIGGDCLGALRAAFVRSRR